MSDILTNANRYSTSNTFRSDAGGNTRGNARNNDGSSIGFDCSGLVYHVLRESGYNIPYAASSVMVDAKVFNGNWATPLDANVVLIPAGSLVYFNGHVGIVKSYDPVSKVGEFLSMTGSGGVGSLKPSESFTTDRNLNPSIHWGGITEFKGLAAVKPELYDSSLDQHANGANHTKPIFNIPEAINSGFVTLPDNGGFSWNKGTRDFSALPNVAAAGQNVASPPPIDLPLPTTAFAEALATLESRGQPDNGYGAVNLDGGGIGAIGRYGFRAPSLKAIGWMDDAGNWTDKAKVNGVDSPEGFRANHDAQESARVAYMGVIKNELKANGAWAMIGQEVEGRVVTESGLIAAGWKEGSLNVLRFFNGYSTSEQKDTNILFRIDRFKDAAISGTAAVIPTAIGISPPTSHAFPDGSVQTEYTAKADSSDGSILKGDRVLEVVKGGTVTLRDVTHIDNSEDQYSNEGGVQTYVRWSPGGNKTLQISTDPKLNLSLEPTPGSAMEDSAIGQAIHNQNSPSIENVNFPSSAITDILPLASMLGGLSVHASRILTQPLATKPTEDNAGWGNINTRDVKFIAQADSPDGLYKAGDKVVMNYDKQGEYTGISAQHKDKSVSSQALGKDPETGERTITSTELDANGKIQTQITTNTASNAVIGPVTLGGVVWRDQSVDGVSRMVDPNGLTATERVQQSNDQEIERQLNRTSTISDEPNKVGLRLLTLEEINAFNAGLQQASTSSGLSGIVLADASGATGNPTISDAGQGGGSINFTTPTISQPNPAFAGVYRNGMDIASDNTADAAQAIQAAGALGLINTLIGLENWDRQSEIGHLSAALAIYSQVNNATNGALGAATGLGTAAAGLGLLASLESGNAGGIVVNAIGFADAVGLGASAAIADALNLGVNAAGGVVPGIGFVLALSTGDPISIASSGLSLLSTLGYIGPWGAAAAIAITILGSLFEDEKPNLPMQEGQAQAVWDADGNISTLTIQDNYGGGERAVSWMSSIAHGLENQLATQVDSQGHAVYSLIPQRLPLIGFKYDPDGFNYQNAAGHVTLTWQNEDGTSQTRYYDGAGRHWVGVGDDLGETLAGDFMKYVQSSHAIVPTWEAKTLLAHFNETVATQGIAAANAQVAAKPQNAMPQEQADGIHQVLSALTFEVPAAITPRTQAQPTGLVDTDGDGYLEQTQWANANQALLAIDGNLDGIITGGELLNIGGNNTARNSLGWLDTNHDNRLDASDPAFAAIRIWLDMSQDGVSQQSEIQTLSQALITAIDFGSNPPTIIKADGTRQLLTVQRLMGDILGVRFQAVEGGLLESKEKGETVLRAVNTRLYDGQADHTHGGDEAAAGSGALAAPQTINKSDARLSASTANTIANTSLQTQATVLAAATGMGAAGSTQAGQVQGQQSTAALITRGNAQLRSQQIAFIPGTGNASTAAQAQREATQEMIRSADSGLFSLSNTSVAPMIAMALGAGAVQWPAVADARPIRSSSDSDNFDDVDLNGGSGRGNNSNNRNNNSNNDQQYINVFGTDASNQQDPNRIELASLESGQVTGDAGSGYSLSPVSVQNPTQNTQNINLDSLNSAATQQIRAREATESIANQNSNDVDSSNDSDLTAFSVTLTSTFFAANAAGSAGSTIALTYPTARGETVLGTEDIGLRISTAILLANDSTLNTRYDPATPDLSISAVGTPTHGQVALRTNERGQLEVVFIPDTDYHGLASFAYTVTDQYGLSNTATAILQIAAVNDAPVTRGETASGNEDAALMFTSASLLANDRDVDTAVDGDVLRISRVGLAQHGTVFLDTNGNTRFVPDADYNGPAQFTYWVSDRDATTLAGGTGYEVAATMNLTVLAVNDLPVVTGERIANDEDIVLDITQSLLLANDTDVDIATSAQVLSISAVSNAQHGTVTLQANGFIQFTPELNYFGAASFVYTVNDGNDGQVQGTAVVNLTPVNDAPDVVGETIAFDEDNIQTITQAALLANDTDVDNAPTDLTIVSVGNATYGTIALNPDGTIHYVPEQDYFGAASFTYTVSDGVGGFTVGTANLNILPVNDAPVTHGEAATLDEDTVARFSSATLLANDTDVDNLHSELRISVVGSATHGTVQIVATGAAAEVVFTPTRNYFGTASFGYTVSDGAGGLTNAVVNLTFNSVNDAPVVNNELVIGKRDIAYTLSQAALLANDTDVETPNNLTVVGIQNFQHGTATLAANGSVTFTPVSGYAGRGSFDYVVQDADGGQTVGTAQIDFSRVNANPVAVDDSFFGYEDTAFVIAANQLLVNDSDPDGGGITTLHVDAVGNAGNGYVTLLGDGSVRFDPVANFYGAATFDYRINDGEGGQTWARAYLTVNSVNDAPVVEDIWYGTPVYDDGAGTGSSAYYQNGFLRPISFIPGAATYDEFGGQITPLIQRIQAVIFDPDDWSGGISFSIAGSATHGATEALGGGVWNYYSHVGDPYTGADPFTIRGTDSGGATVDAIAYPTHYGSSIGGGGGGGGCPIAIDLNGDGVNLIRAEDSTIYADINHSGWRQRLGWTNTDDGVLVFDGNKDNVVDLDTEISFTHFKHGARTDLEGLAGLDSNGDGKISAEDNEWGQLKIFRDTNGNGHQDVGELLQLAALGITSIGLEPHSTPQLDHGNVVFGTADVSFADGHMANAADVMFVPQNAVLSNEVRAVLGLPVVAEVTVAPTVPVLPVLPVVIEISVTEQAQIMHAALLFNQYCSANSSIQSVPLAYVNWAQAQHGQLLDDPSVATDDHTGPSVASAGVAAQSAQSFA